MKPFVHLRTAALAFIFIIYSARCMSQNPPDYGFQVGYGSSVGALIAKGDTMFVGGEFDYIGLYTGSMVSIDLSTGAVNRSFPVVNGPIKVILPDGSGGYYIGGSFSRVNGYTKVGLAHILPNKTLDIGWEINVDDGAGVYALLFSKTKDTMWVGGNFNSIGGVSKSKVAAIKMSTRTVISNWGPGSFNNNWWQPNPVVCALAYFPGEGAELPKLFVGGDFMGINWTSKANLAALDAGNGTLLTNWRADIGPVNHTVTGIPVSPVVRSLLFDGCCANKYLYVGGLFSNLTDNTGSHARHSLAVTNISGNGAFLNTFSSSIQPQNDSGLVNCMQILKDGNGVRQLFIGGKFRDVGNKGVQNFTMLSRSSGTPTIYAGGYVNGRVVDTTFIPGQYASGEVRAFDTVGSDIVIVGDFEGIQTNTPTVQVRRNVARFNMAGNGIKPLFPMMQTNMPANAMAISGNELCVGGDFTSAGGELRKNLAAVDLSQNKILPFNPRPDSYVNDFEFSVTKDTLYAGGNFTLIGPSQRGYTAAFDIRTNTLLPWSTTVATGGGVEDLQLDTLRNILYAGGKFNTMGGLSKNHLAALNSRNGKVYANWTANVTTINGQITPVRSLALSPNADTLFVAGRFNSIAGQNRRNLAAVFTKFSTAPADTTAVLLSWDFPVVETNDVGACVLLQKNGRLYVGGKYSSIGGVAQGNLAAINIFMSPNNIDLGWLPTVTDGGGGVWCMQIAGGMVFFGGDFGKVNNVVTSFSAAVTVSGASIVAAYRPYPSVRPFGGVLNSMLIRYPYLYLGGSHTSMTDVAYDAVFHLNTVSGFQDMVLPVRLSYFNATGVGKASYIQWNAIGDPASYTLQRSLDGISFTSIGTFTAANSTYKDNNVERGGTYYYRLQIHSDNETRYSPVRRVVIAGDGERMRVWALNNSIRVIIPEDGYVFQLSTASGQRLFYRSLTEGINDIAAGPLLAGIYFYTIQKNGKIQTGKLLVK